VSGNVTALTGAAVGIRTGSTIRGNYTCNNCLFADLGGSTIGGNVVISGEAEGSFINGSTIKGNLKIDSSSAGPESFSIGTTSGNVIRGNLSFTNNTGPSFIVDNRIAGYLACQNNVPAPTSSGNTAKSFQGNARPDPRVASTMQRDGRSAGRPPDPLPTATCPQSVGIARTLRLC
jgi:hypothetical protein